MEPAASGATLANLELSIGEDGQPTIRVDATGNLAAACEWLAHQRGALRAALDLYGSVLIRRLPFGDPADFAAVRDTLIERQVRYREKATPRSDYGNGVLSSTDLPATQPIRLHNENSYTLDFPGILLFGCLVAPDEGGATTTADAREVLASLPVDLVERFRQVGWVLTRSYHDHVSLPWSTAFSVSERNEVEEYCRRNLIGYRWLPGDGLLTSQRRAVTIHHPATGQEVWFNHIAFWNEHSLDPDVREVLRSSYGPDGLPFNTFYGDGSPIPDEEVAVLNAAYERAQRRESWQAGDLLLVDNILTCHGREPFRGDRKILVAMGEQVALADCRPTTEPAPGPLAR